ncbi:MAG: hypothetical protein ACI9XO_001827 [Paraglaciecola sp.]|jgi:hypothetical protein
MLIIDNITALAQSATDLEKAKPLVSTKKWRVLEANEQAVWGEVKSNGVAYYKTQFFPKTKQFRCNCPSQKKPCPHVLALMMLFVENGISFKINPTLPKWVADWLLIKDQPAAKRTEEQEVHLAELRLKTREKRLLQMEEGLNELNLWLNDVVRQGLANLEMQPPEFWEEIAGRLVNAKCGRLARRVRHLPMLFGTANWHETMLGEIGELYLLLKGFKNIQNLPPALQQEMLNQAGINVKKEELIEIKGVQDTWLVIGQTEGKDEDTNLFYRRTWMAGEKTEKVALLLEYAWSTNPYETNFKPGNQFRGEVVYYPSAFDLRVSLRNFQTVVEPFLVKGYSNFNVFSKEYAKAVGGNPWLLVFPAILENVVPIFEKDAFYLLDENQKMLPIKTEEKTAWTMLALSGGEPITFFGAFENQVFQPLSAILADQFIVLHDAKPLPRPKRTWGNF